MKTLSTERKRKTTKKLEISENVQLELNQVIGKSIGILGIRGSGKTNTAAVMIEELLKFNFPVAIIDIDGEYWGLKEKYELLVLGHGKNADVEINMDLAEPIARFFIEKEIPIIMDFSDFLIRDIHRFLVRFFKTIWELTTKVKRPYMIVIEEAHEFIPQGIRTELKEYITRIALRGRKRGLGLIIVSQRSAKVDKDVLTQCEILFLHRVVHPVDLSVYKAILPWPPKKVEDLVPKLAVGECVFYLRGVAQNILVRRRYTFHAGYTPTFKAIRRPKLKHVNSEIIRALSEYAKSKRKEKDLLEELREENERLKATLAEKEKEIQKLTEQIEMLSKLRLEIKGDALLTAPVTDHQVQSVVQIEKREIREDSISGLNSPSKYSQPIQRHIQRILQKISRLSKSAQQIVSFLVEQEPNKYSYEQLASWLNYSKRTIIRNLPTSIIKIGLLKKQKEGRKVFLYSDLRHFIEKEFAGYLTRNEIQEKDILYLYNLLRDKIIQLNEGVRYESRRKS